MVSGQVVRVTLPAEFRDLYWFANGGALERHFREPSADSILLDLSALVWADPVPLLSLACLCADYRDRGGSLTIDLGTHKNPSHRFRIFFAQHGFLSAIAAGTIVKWDNREYGPDSHTELEQDLRRLPGALAYQDAECIPAKLVSSNAVTPEDLETFVEGLVEIAHPRISSWLPGNSRRRGLMSHQLRVFLTEALDNIQEHAYRKAEGYGAIYARIRAGRPEEPAALRNWSDAKLREKQHCPTLYRCRAERRPGWLELFVCDVGVGLTHDYPSSEMAPLQKLSAQLFADPVSRHADRRVMGKTNMTGLQRIGKLLLPAQDQNSRGEFVRVYSNGEWVGEHLPWPKSSEALPGIRNALREKEASPPKGTVFHFAIEPPPATAAEQATLYPSAFYRPEFLDLSKVREELARERSRPSPTSVLFDIYRLSGQTFAHDPESFLEKDAAPAKTIIIRPSRVQRKTQLIQQISAFLRAGPTVTDLVLADVPWSSAIDFYHIISSQSYWRNTKQVSSASVHILSQDWFCATLVFDSGSHRFEGSLEHARNFILRPSNSPSAAEAAAVLRRQDSMLFWSAATNAYLNEPVIWRHGSAEQTSTILGYLDLNYALALPTVYECARRAVRRTVSALAPDFVHAADDIIARVLASDFELTPAPLGSPSKRRTVLAGSVLGSGNTVQRFSRGVSEPYSGLLQLLRHPDFPISAAEQLAALDWLPPKPKDQYGPPAFERVSNTPFVIRGGEAAVPLPRFSRPGIDGGLGRSLYGEEPNEAYQRWQRLGLLRMGHWTYGTNHDLLTLRLGDALVYDAAEGGTVVGWLAERVSEWIPSDNGRPSGFVIYAQHEVSSELARMLSRHPLCNGIPFFPAAAPSSIGKAALLLSPMTREAVITACQENMKGGGSAIILDDAIVSGATMRSIRQAIDGLWEALRDARRIDPSAKLQVKTLAIVDRSGEPAQRLLVERDLDRDQRFWRWDVPSLGHDSTCIVCGLRARWQALSPAVHGSLLHDRLDQWSKQWAPTAVSEGRFDAGVPARRLQVQSSTRFGIERNHLAHRVKHSLSVSRVSIAAEIAGSTTRKDYPLRKAREALLDSSEVDKETALEILTTQLLLFEDDLNSADRVERLEAVLELLWLQPEANISTALAAMTTLLDLTIVEEVWRACARLIGQRGFPHEDTILAALGLFYMAGPATAPALKLGSAWEVFDLCRRPSTEARQAIAMVLRVFGWSPNSVHRTTLPDKLLKKVPSATELTQTILMLERLADAVQGMPPLAVEGSVLSPTDDGAAIRAIASSLAQIRGAEAESEEHAGGAVISTQINELLEEGWKLLFSRRGLRSEYRRQLCATVTGDDAVEKILTPAWRMVVERWSALLIEKGPLMIGRWSAPPVVWFEPSGAVRKAVDIYYDGTVSAAIGELMSNVIHSSGQIACPWPDGSSVPQADLWARVRFDQDGAYALIELANGYSGAGDIRPQMTPSLVHLSVLNGSFETRTDQDRRLVFTTIMVPTAAGIIGL